MAREATADLGRGGFGRHALLALRSATLLVAGAAASSGLVFASLKWGRLADIASLMSLPGL